MVTQNWLNMTESACYLRISEELLREELKRGKIPYSKFGGQLLFNTSQLDEFLFGLQEHSVEESGLSEKVQQNLQIASSIKHNFMQQACKLWDDGNDFTVKFRTKGASCQFKGQPRIWVFPNKFQIPAKEKGNELYERIRETLTEYFSHITSKATVHIDLPNFKWEDFVKFIGRIKDICKEHPFETHYEIRSADAADDQKSGVLNIYDDCIKFWQDLPEFTVVYGTRGCSARHKNKSRLWLFRDCIRVPTESQGNNLFEFIKAVKEEHFPYLRTKTKIPIQESDVDWKQISSFINSVKAVCKQKGEVV